MLAKWCGKAKALPVTFPVFREAGSIESDCLNFRGPVFFFLKVLPDKPYLVPAVWFIEITRFLVICSIGRTWNNDPINKIVVYSPGCISFLTLATYEIY